MPVMPAQDPQVQAAFYAAKDKAIADFKQKYPEAKQVGPTTHSLRCDDIVDGVQCTVKLECDASVGHPIFFYTKAVAHVSYETRELAKSAGFRFDGYRKEWYKKL